jgi:hypothetical protein
MGVGVYNNSGLGVSELAVTNIAPGTLAQNIPTGYDKGHGQMDFLKRSSGDTLYIGLCGKKPSPKQYDIILTDAQPFFNVEGIALGDITVLGTGIPGTNPSIISITILACT